jgi:hypothetical protein
MMKILSKIRKIVRYEDGGANIYIILAIGFGLLLVTPFFLNSGSLYITRRSSQNGADAAALAAAEYYAERLTFNKGMPAEGDYYTPPPQYCLLENISRFEIQRKAVEAYFNLKYLPVVREAQSFRLPPQVQSVAERNNTKVRADYFRAGNCEDDCEKVKISYGYRFPNLWASTITEREFISAVSGYSNLSDPIRAHATAVTYMPDQLELYGPYRCQDHVPPYQDVVINGVAVRLYYLRYLVKTIWRIHLIDYRGLPFPQ